jgi:hypothetical protein
MATKRKPAFDPSAFLAKAKDQLVFSQGEPADAVFYIQCARIILLLLPRHSYACAERERFVL